MEYLFQFQIKADDIYYKKPLDFKLDGVGITLYLDDENNWISKGKKAHITVSATNKNEAYALIWNKLGDFNNRLIFITGEAIVISHLEFFIFDQTGQETRDIFFRDIKLPGIHKLDYFRLNNNNEFFNLKLSDVHKSAIRFFNQAVLSNSDHEIFKSLYRAIEQLAGSKLVEAKCDKQDCGGVLICPNCKSTKQYPRVTTSHLQQFLDSTNHTKKFGVRNLSAKNLAKIRGKLSHIDFKSSKKNKFAINEINDVNHDLSLLIRWYIEEQYEISWPGSSVNKSGTVAAIDKQFITEHPNQKFALDIPPLEDFSNNRQNTRWII